MILGFRILRVADVDAIAVKVTSTRNAVADFPFHMTVPTAGPPRHLAVNSDGSILSVCVSENGACVVHFYDIQSFYDRVTQYCIIFYDWVTHYWITFYDRVTHYCIIFMIG